MARQIKKTATQLRNEKQALNSGQAALAAIFTKEDEQFKVHADGTVERLNRASVEKAAYFLKGKRVFDKYEVMEELNKDWVNYMVTAGYARKVVQANPNNPHFYVTKKAAAHFGLKPVTSFGMPFQFVD